MPDKNKAALRSWLMSFPSNLTPALLISCFLFVSIAAVAQLQGSNELKVVEASGAVKIRQEELWLSPDIDMMLDLPAVISTGADGSIKLAQKETAISIAANSAIELLEGPAAGQIVERVVQDSGSAFYDVESGKSTRFRVETPYLVAVVKGTQFNVTVAAESSTVALYEGQLRIEAPDGSDAVDLHKGQIAKRHRGDSRITVLAMEDGEPVARESLPAIGGGATAESAEADIGIESDDTLDAESLELTGSGDLAGDDILDASLDSDVDLDDASLDTGLDADADLGDGTLDTSLDSDPALDDATADTSLDADADLDDGTLDTSLDSDLALDDTT
ncbi:MAG: FecR family protein, partial [Woeseia sp.]